jgi:predicted small lipoprotein YifL
MRRTLFIIILAMLVQACGTRGPLYLPPPDQGDKTEAGKKKP